MAFLHSHYLRAILLTQKPQPFRDCSKITDVPLNQGNIISTGKKNYQTMMKADRDVCVASTSMPVSSPNDTKPIVGLYGVILTFGSPVSATDLFGGAGGFGQ